MTVKVGGGQEQDYHSGADLPAVPSSGIARGRLTRYAVRRLGGGPETEDATRIDLQSDGVQGIRPRWRAQGVSLR